MYEMSARNSPVNAFVSSTETLCRLVPLSHVKSAKAKGARGGCESGDTEVAPCAVARRIGARRTTPDIDVRVSHRLTPTPLVRRGQSRSHRRPRRGTE